MSNVSDHYQKLLARYYSWMFGDFDNKVLENVKFFCEHQIQPNLSGEAIDLGSGPGFQSIALANAGFTVKSVDLSKELLDELNSKINKLSILTVQDNLLNFENHISTKPELIVCMGDTLTHLESMKDVESLLKSIYSALQKSGKVILTFRDMTFRLEDTDRFIPVRSDENIIFTCFLEYEETHVQVNDIIYEKESETWNMKKSNYRKLIIDPEWLRNLMEDLNFNIRLFTINKGMVSIIAEK